MKLAFHIAYFVVIGALLGATFTLGAFVAPVIFKATLFFDNLPIDVYQSGRLMSEIFRRFNYLLIFALIVVAAYEIWRFVVKDRSKIAMVSAIAVLVFGSLFAAYYVPEILYLQSLGVSHLQTAEFDAIHTQSEYVFKLLLFANLALLITHLLRFRAR
ncbi:MAG: DUF4149 domain-containing protein [Helicobacteraceae bacterium]|jgi:hypothetical protein|nr:DUF4149 domain-containing protein [Helicobacteraceae bacterium]